MKSFASAAGISDANPQRLREQLGLALTDLLTGARLKLTSLPLSYPPTLPVQLEPAVIKLWLINPRGMDAPLSEQETSDIFANPPYWSFCWGSGLALAQRILANPQWVVRQTVLDFGCGSGVVAIAAALAGASRVISCDIDTQALAATAVNAFENNVVLEYLDDFSELNESVDLLFAADVLYDPKNLPLLQAFCRQASTVIVADSRVKIFDEQGFSLFGQTHAVTVPDLGEQEDVKQVRFYLAGAMIESEVLRNT